MQTACEPLTPPACPLSQLHIAAYHHDDIENKIASLIRSADVTLRGQILCSQSVLFEGNLSLLGLDPDGNPQPGRSRSSRDLLQARDEFATKLAKQICLLLHHSPAISSLAAANQD